jgi:uncharacterized C2H2 Zn-finger protein
MVEQNKASEPVLCSKCNKLFDNDNEYINHFNNNHR